MQIPLSISRLLLTVLLLISGGMTIYALPQKKLNDFKPAHATAAARVILPSQAVASDNSDLVDAPTSARDINNPGSGMQKVFRGKYHTVTPEGTLC